MIPDSFVGLVLFVSLLSPGFVYLQARERRHPGIDYSPLRETSLIVVTSIATLGVAMLIAWIFRGVRPTHSPDVGAYVTGGAAYLRKHHAEAASWSGGLVVLACVLAYFLAVPPAALARGHLRSWVLDRRGTGVIEQKSGWSAAFDAHRDHRKVVEVVLTDGTTLFGLLGSRSTQIAETADRDLVLAAPIQVREVGTNWIELPMAGTLVVSAARIKYMVVSYQPRLSTGKPPSKTRRPRQHRRREEDPRARDGSDV